MSLMARRRLWSFFEALYSQELSEASPRDPTPEWIKTPLLQHQQSALAAARALERGKLEGIDVGSIAGDTIGGRLYTSYGILGDHVGSGKSLIALSLLKSPPPPNEYTEFIMRAGAAGDGRDVGLLRSRSHHTTVYGTALRPVRTAIVIVPHALINQWETYITRDTTIRARFVRKRTDTLDDTFMATIEDYDAIVVSATMWTALRSNQMIRNILWSRVFIDEADTISLTTNADELYGLFYWFISASWLNLIFSNGAYFNLTSSHTPLPETPAHIVQRVAKLQKGNSALNIPGCRHMNIVRRMCGISPHSSSVALNAAAFQSLRLIVHSSMEYLHSSFRQPSITHRNILCETPTNIAVLDSLISPAMMEHLHAGDVSGALDMLGMTAHTHTEIISAVTASLIKELENARRTYEFKQSLEYSSDALKAKALETCQQKITSVEERIQSIQQRIERATDQTCPICYGAAESPAVVPCCQQVFCFACVCETLKRTPVCPMCRARITDIKNVHVVGTGGAAATVAAPRRPNKKDALLQFIRDNPTAKILLFSSYDATVHLLEQALRDEPSIRMATVMGTSARITRMIKDFGNGKYNVLFLNARNMGSGLNIDSATHVVMYHRMSSDLEEQIVGRANRLGRTAPLEVVHLLHSNEVDVAATTAV